MFGDIGTLLSFIPISICQRLSEVNCVIDRDNVDHHATELAAAMGRCTDGFNVKWAHFRNILITEFISRVS